MRIESVVIPTSAAADLQAVSIACKREKTEPLALFLAHMEAPEAPGVSGWSAGAHDETQHFLPSSGLSLGRLPQH